MYTLNNNLP